MKATTNSLAKLFFILLVNQFSLSAGIYLLDNKIGIVALAVSLIATPIFFIISLVLLARRTNRDV